MLCATTLNMIGFDTSTPINCQVSPVSPVWPVTLSDQLCPQFKGLGHCWTRECLFLLTQFAVFNAPISVSRFLVTPPLLLRRY